MFSKILVPLDGSTLAESALPYAQALAHPYAAQLILLRTTQDRSGGGSQAEHADQDTDIAEANSYLNGLANGPDMEGIEVEVLTAHAKPPDGIVEQARSLQVDLIVMATHARVGPSRWLRGSVAESVLSRTNIPMLLLRASDDARNSISFPEHPRLVVPLDGSVFSEGALPAAEELAKTLSGELILVRSAFVDEPESEGPVWVEDGESFRYLNDEPDIRRDDSEHYLREHSDELGSRGLTASIEVCDGEPAECIAISAIENGASMIVMATHGRTGVRRTMAGSVAGDVLRRVKIPILLVRPRPDEAEPDDASIEEYE